MSINSVVISGNLTREPELRATQGGTPVLSFGLAVNERRKDAAGNWTDYPNFVGCVMFGARAEKLAQYLEKGAKVAAFGHLHYSEWEKDGQKRSKLEVVVDDLELMTRSKPENGAHNTQTANYSASAPSAPKTATRAPQAPLYDEDIPF